MQELRHVQQQEKLDHDQQLKKQIGALKIWKKRAEKLRTGAKEKDTQIQSLTQQLESTKTQFKSLSAKVKLLEDQQVTQTAQIEQAESDAKEGAAQLASKTAELEAFKASSSAVFDAN